ncbi:Muscle M-line assembly protein unc-89 [Folsomia candida]|uniref:Muscle M-line assembly protein unc-89 n=1 Tax=Folsomia candida TaxID=158441 RepID=A0A226F6V7_FOLCA|nr:Muscle M-line assembly protein unc-89 [Folsomia candida]
MGSKCCKNSKSPPDDQNRLLRRELSSGDDQYRSSNNNLYPLRISELRPVANRSQSQQKLYTFIPPTNSSPQNKNAKSEKNGKKMTLITGMAKSDTASTGGGGGPPIFIRQLNDTSIKVALHSLFKVTFYRNDVKIINTLSSSSSGGGDSQPRYLQGNEGRFYFLDISEVHIEDEGKWICLIENFHGRSSSTCLVKVMVPKAYKYPEFVEGLKAILTSAGTVSLECKVIGTPTCILKWYKDGKEIRAGDIFALRGDPSSLGVYTVEACNCMGSVTSSSKVHMLGGSADEDRLTVVQNLSDCRVRVGDKHEFQFKLSRPLGNKDVIQWFNKSQSVELKDRLIPSADGSVCKLFVSQVEVQDEGEWECFVTTAGNQKVSSSCSMSILIPRNYRRPRFLEQLRAILTEEGLVSFECKVCGFPTPNLVWTKDNVELKPGDVYQLSGANSLGVYQCIARNCMGNAQSSTELTLEDIQHQLSDDEKRQLLQDKTSRPPKFLKGLKSIEQKIGESCQLQVQVNDPKATVSWFRDGIHQIESDDEKYSIKQEGGLG